MSERYEIKGKLGRGGIGAVYTGYDTQLDREVAIKRLLPLEETQLNEADTGSLNREAAALAKFQHPNVVTIFGFEEDEDGPFVVTELINGENLKVLIEKGALSVRDFQEFVSQTLDALIAAEQLNLLHRDIKPANLMLLFLPSGKFQVKILDFGLAKFSQTPSAQTLDQKGSFLGSIDYIAPEQLERLPLDQRTDLYSLGCVCYFALTQRPPFEGKTLVDTMNNHLKHKVIPISSVRPDLPPAIAIWVMNLIALNPEHRPKNATEAVREFEQAKLGVSPEQRGGDGSSAPISGSAPVTVTPAPSSTPATEPQPPPSSKVTGPQPNTRRGRRILTEPVVDLPSRTSSIDLGASRTSPGRSQKRPRPANSEKKMGGAIAVLVIAVVLGGAGLVFIFGSRGGDEKPGDDVPVVAIPEEESQPTTPEVKETGKGLPQPSLTPPPKPGPQMVLENKLPVSADELAGHFVASELIFQLDQKTGAKPGDRVGSWGNLVWEEGKSAHFLARIYGDEDGRYCPRVVLAGPSQFPELNGPQTLIRFEEDTTLTMPFERSFTEELAGTKITCVMVCEISVDQGPMLRIYTKKGNKQSVNFLPRANRFVEVSVNDKGENASFKTRYNKRGTFGVLTYVRDGSSQELSIVGSDGKRYDSGKQPCLDGAFMLEGIALGVSPKNKWGVTSFAGHVAELAVFGRAFSEEERKATEDHLFAKYFRPKNAPKEAGAAKQTSNAPVISDSPIALEIPQNPASADHGVPVPPHVESLAAHYSTQGWVFGKGFAASAKVGDKVYAWGNLTPGVGKQYILGSLDEKYGAPKLVEISSSEFPELKNGTRALRFTPQDSMVTPKSLDGALGLNGDQMTVVTFIRPDKIEKNRILKFDAYTQRDANKPVRGMLNLLSHSNVFLANMRVGKQWPNSSGRRKSENFFIHSLQWNGRTGDLLSVSRDSKGNRTKGNTQPNGNRGKMNIIRYALGRDIINAKDLGFSGDVVEVLIFSKLLSDEQIIEVENWMAERYFK